MDEFVCFVEDAHAQALPAMHQGIAIRFTVFIDVEERPADGIEEAPAERFLSTDGCPQAIIADMQVLQQHVA